MTHASGEGAAGAEIINHSAIVLSFYNRFVCLLNAQL